MNRSTANWVAGIASLSCLVGIRYLLCPRVVGTRDAISVKADGWLIVDRVSVWVPTASENKDTEETKDIDAPTSACVCQHILWSFRRVFLDDAVMHSFA